MAEKSSGLLSGVLRTLGNHGEKGTTVGVIRNENGRKKVSVENIEKALDFLIGNGQVGCRENIASNGRKSLYYFIK